MLNNDRKNEMADFYFPGNQWMNIYRVVRGQHIYGKHGQEMQV